MSVRAVFLLVVLVLVSVPVRAQAPTPGPPPGAGVNPVALAKEVAALKARVDKLEGKNLTVADLAGTYEMAITLTAVAPLIPGAPPRNASVIVAAAMATVTVNADGTGSSGPMTFTGSELIQGLWRVVPFGLSGPAENFTWSYTDGALTITTPSEDHDLVFNVGVGGRILTRAEHESFSDGSANASLTILTKR